MGALFDEYKKLRKIDQAISRFRDGEKFRSWGHLYQAFNNYFSADTYVHAQFRMAELYRTGIHDPKDTKLKADKEEAIAYYRKAAAQGHALAQQRLDELSGNKKKFRLMRAKAVNIKRIEKKAAQGDAEAQYDLGLYYINELDGADNAVILPYMVNDDPEDFPIAKAWFEKAAAQGHGQAKLKLEELRRRNEDKPFNRYLKAAEQGDAEAQIIMGDYYHVSHYGSTQWENYEKTKAWVEKAAAQGSEQAKEYLAELEKQWADEHEPYDDPMRDHCP